MSDYGAPQKKQKLDGDVAAPREGLLEQLQKKQTQKAATLEETQKKEAMDEMLVNNVLGIDNYYAALGLKYGAANDDAVRAKGKELKLKLHPDRNHAVGAKDAFQRVQQICDTLLDPVKKAAYFNALSGRGGNGVYAQPPRAQAQAPARPRPAASAKAAAAPAVPVGGGWRQMPRTQPPPPQPARTQPPPPQPARTQSPPPARTQTKPSAAPRRSEEHAPNLVGVNVHAPHKLLAGDRIRLFTSAGPFGFDVTKDTEMGDPISLHVSVQPHMNREVRVSRVLVMRIGGVNLILDRDAWTGYKNVREDPLRQTTPFFWKPKSGPTHYAATAVDAAVSYALSLGD